ncbi:MULTISPECIES: hypothetical protein [Pseudomonadaceae]|uniref:hypothetical protein n=1 Tax=Pseudomonadaceae TaxID=135621 RepID=UPI00103D7245|nr:MULTISPECIES: hypothetical protein [Pseudomonadaceae]MCQ4260977.1 hypothetical protein [Stutzerimonas stutzeri]TCD19185.1 hypothetical protein E0D86_19445 [Pseudomonas sp. IC_126]
MARRSKLAQKKHNIAIAMMVAAVITMIAIGGAIAYLYMGRDEPVDSVTLCPAPGPEGHTVLLVDNTDPMNFIQRQAMTQRLKEAADKLVPEGHMVSVFVLGESFTDNAMPIFEKCNPGTGEGKNSLNSNPKRIKKRFVDEFQGPLVRLRDQVVLDTPSDRSPIFEMLHLLSINGFSRIDAQGPRTLIIFSDMLQHMPEFSMFKALPEFKAFRESTYGRKSQARLEGVEVHLNYLLNHPKLQTNKQASFWEQYFDNSGAHLVSVKAFEG